ncbi:MAG: adenosine deaminase, partial [Rickettsiales bacterium]
MTANNALPKAELHVHLEGTISPELAQKLAKRNNLPLPDGLFNAKGDYNWADFTQFLNSYDAASSVIRTKQDYSDITYEYLASIAKEGALYAELGIAPDITRDIIGLEYDELLQGLEDGVNRARAEFGIDARMIATAVRHLGPKKATEMAKLVAANPHPLVTGFGLAGDERMHSPADFAEAFQIAHKAGLGCTAHAGEFGGPESVRDTIEALPVSRIGHGVRAAEDAELLQDLADRGITLEVCPNSNIALKVFDSFESHSFPALYEAG